jgi:hypothetical protein
MATDPVGDAVALFAEPRLSVDDRIENHQAMMRRLGWWRRWLNWILP